jgi:predicted transcriptional regulator
MAKLLHVNRGGIPTTLGPLESDVMDVVWSMDGWLTVNDVIAKLNGRGVKILAYTTVKSVLGNLAVKKLLDKRSAGKQSVFRPALSCEDFQGAMIDVVVGPLLKLQRNPLLARIAGELAADEQSYAEFERLIVEKRALRRNA